MNVLNPTKPYYEEVEVLLEELLDQEASDLVVYNDEVNTFDHVINVLMKVCEHTREQAEQCALIIHYKGKCAVKKGSFEELKPCVRPFLMPGFRLI